MFQHGSHLSWHFCAIQVHKKRNCTEQMGKSTCTLKITWLCFLTQAAPVWSDKYKVEIKNFEDNQHRTTERFGLEEFSGGHLLKPAFKDCSGVLTGCFKALFSQTLEFSMDEDSILSSHVQYLTHHIFPPSTTVINPYSWLWISWPMLSGSAFFVLLL